MRFNVLRLIGGSCIRRYIYHCSFVTSSLKPNIATKCYKIPDHNICNVLMHVSGTSFANQYYNSTSFSDSKLHLGDRKGIQPVRNLCQLFQKALVWSTWYNLIPQKRQLVKQ